MADSCITIERITKRYPGQTEDTLKGIDLTIAKGDRYGILGPNGAGKTTLISILCGLQEPSSGHFYYWGDSEINKIEVKQQLGFVPQEYAFYGELSPMQNLEYFGAMYKLSRAEIKSRSLDILNILGLSEVKNKKVGVFSGGMKRRMNLAIGIIHQPAVIFLDEPTVGVDVQSKMAIIKLLEHLNEEGATIIYTSHHLDEAEEFCNRVALIDHGEIIIKGNTQHLLQEHEVDLKGLLINLTGESYRD
ncbi:ABC transporter ATP-binding protein [Fulvivirga maritima]|uniref:ABC transporter ATP-binding protein n=1 Tax=Fulvivirga maritima TaxID=2904247 RepID=UPI001F45CB77|nr:ABC transporter ATP-binding protein [Fulvivirga maritima]UII27332.1 ABC transporter ATP-binding protein [Fulvivirga maritima]